MPTSLAKSFIFYLIVLAFSVQCYGTSKCWSLFTGNLGSLRASEIEVLPEVLTLEEGEGLSASTYDEYGINRIARSLVERRRILEVDHSALDYDSVEIDLWNNSEVMIFFWPQIATSIAEKGFLNMFLSGHTQGLPAAGDRLLAEDRLVGLKLGYEREALRLRPKSGFLNILDQNAEAGYFNSQELEARYGPVVAVLKNEIKSQSLWVAGDSLHIGGVLEYAIRL